MFLSRKVPIYASIILTICSTIDLPEHEAESFTPAVQIQLSGDCHPNPGPVYKFPCGICQGPCKSNQNCVACDSCDTWFHTKCMNMPNAIFHGIKNVSWTCFSCGIPNFSTTLFETHYSDSLATSVATENTYSILSPTSATPLSPDLTNHDSFSSLDSSIGSPQQSSSPIKARHQPSTDASSSFLHTRQKLPHFLPG